MKGLPEKFLRCIWAGLILLLPITSMPAVIRLVRSDSVAAPSVLFLFVFVLVWIIPYTVRGEDLPGTMKPFLAFCAWAIFTTLISNYSLIPVEKGHNPLPVQFSAIITLAIGAAFYMVFSLYPATDTRMKWTLRLINLAGLVMLLWAGMQATAWYANHGYPRWMRDLHELFSAGPLNRQRVMGFALEPSWLAHQLNMVFLPLWLAASIKRFSAHKFKIAGLSFENLLLAGGVIVLLLTLSRIGLMAFLFVLGYLAVQATRWVSRKISDRIKSGELQEPAKAEKRKRIASAAIFMGFGLLFIMIVIGTGWILSKMDIRTAKLFHFDFNKEDPIFYYAQQINIAARLVYWQAGWNIFTQHPWLGVGFGNAGFFIPKNLSNYALGLMEVRQLLYRSDVLLNIKCLWARILAETGIIGFTLFVCWFFNIWVTGRFLEKQRNRISEMIGLATAFACISMVIEGFSVDTFALPYFWIIPGLSTATLIMVSQYQGVKNEK